MALAPAAALSHGALTSTLLAPSATRSASHGAHQLAFRRRGGGGGGGGEGVRWRSNGRSCRHVCRAALDLDASLELLNRGLHAQSVEELAVVGETTLIAAASELEQAFPAATFPAQLLESSAAGLRDYMQLPQDERLKRLGIVAALWLYLTARPGVVAGLVDAILTAPLQTVVDFVRGRKALKRQDFILGRRLGEGSFGTVYEGALKGWGNEVDDDQFGRRSKKLEDVKNSEKLRKVVLKKVKLEVTGAEQCGEAEAWFNLRMRRVAPESVAEYLGSFTADATQGQFKQGGRWLVWNFEGESTLADYMTSRSFPDNLGPLLFRESFMDNVRSPKRQSLIIKKLLRQIVIALKTMHSTGVIHRDIKPSNLVITNKGTVKLIDFGAAADLRVGKNYVPEMALLDPDYCPPELYILPESTPRVPFKPLAAFLSPILFQLNHPDLFDTYSLGIILLQMASPSLRSPVGMQAFKQELKEADFNLKAWRKQTRSRPNLELLDLDGGKGWDLATKLVCRRGALLKGRLSAGEVLRHPYFLFGGDRAASFFSMLSFSR